LNKATQQNASASEELAATAEELGGQAGQLQELMDFFVIENSFAAARRGTPGRTLPRRAAGASSRTPGATAVGYSESEFEKF
jgi:methyl-accepting chemotaxis protein